MVAEAKGPGAPWEDELPSVRRVLGAGLLVGLLWGLAFGWIDDELWTALNWIQALAAAVLLVALILVVTRIEARRKRV